MNPKDIARLITEDPDILAEMEIQEIAVNGSKAYICQNCIDGTHTDETGYDHREGEIDYNDCKNTGIINDQLVQCQCSEDWPELMDAIEGVPGLGEMNLLTNYDDTMLAMAELEGEGWLDEQLNATESDELTVPNMLKYIKRAHRETEENKAELAVATDPDDIAYLKRMLNRLETNTVGDAIYGTGGWHRYMVRENGKVLYTVSHGRTDAEKAKELGFEFA